MRPLLFVVVLLTGCLRDADPFEVETSPLQVHAVLQAGATSATVLVSRPSADPNSFVPVSGADVRLITGGLGLQLIEQSGGGTCAAVGVHPAGTGAGCYTASFAEPIEAGQEYGLEIVLADGHEVTGRTTVPEPVRFVAPALGPRVYQVACPPSGDPTVCHAEFSEENGRLEPLTVLELSWLEPGGAGRVDVVMRPLRATAGETQYPGSLCTVEPNMLIEPVTATRESLSWPVYTIVCREPLEGPGWDVLYLAGIVSVADTSYTRYMDAVVGRDAARIGAVSAGLSGALGVFGSMNASTRELAIIRVSETPR